MRNALPLLLLLAACPGDDAPDGPNPARLWLVLDGPNETMVKLSATPPLQPF